MKRSSTRNMCYAAHNTCCFTLVRGMTTQVILVLGKKPASQPSRQDVSL